MREELRATCLARRAFVASCEPKPYRAEGPPLDYDLPVDEEELALVRRAYLPLCGSPCRALLELLLLQVLSSWHRRCQLARVAFLAVEAELEDLVYWHKVSRRQPWHKARPWLCVDLPVSRQFGRGRTGCAHFPPQTPKMPK